VPPSGCSKNIFSVEHPDSDFIYIWRREGVVDLATIVKGSERTLMMRYSAAGGMLIPAYECIIHGVG